MHAKQHTNDGDSGVEVHVGIPVVRDCSEHLSQFDIIFLHLSLD